MDISFREVWKNLSGIQGWLSYIESYTFFKLSKSLSVDGTIVEIGSYEGRSTVAFASGARTGVKIFAIDPHTGDKTQVEAGLQIDTFAKFLRNTQDFPSIIPIRKLSVEARGDVGERAINILFVDGWHSEIAVTEDIFTWTPLCTVDSVIIFDDFGQPEVERAIQKNLCKLPPVWGKIGKDLIFSSNPKISQSVYFNLLRILTPKKVKEDFKYN